VTDVVSAMYYEGYYCMWEASGFVTDFGPGGVAGPVQLANPDINLDPYTAILADGDQQGWWTITRLGEVTAWGSAVNGGGVNTALGHAPNGPILAAAAYNFAGPGSPPIGDTAYMLVGTDGGTFAFGNFANWGNVQVGWSLPSTYAQQIAQVMLPEGNWGGTNQWGNGLQPLWQNESSWDWSLRNGGGHYPSCNYTNVAYGLPQSLPGNKMSYTGPSLPPTNPPAWEVNAWSQIMWGFYYISGDSAAGGGGNGNGFNSPAGAWYWWYNLGHHSYMPTT
jgi:hypothetical protein